MTLYGVTFDTVNVIYQRFIWCTLIFSGKGVVVGILKVGHRKLFVYDNMNKQHEVDPLCVLDFYIHESRQRMGCGKKLYEFMLQVT